MLLHYLSDSLPHHLQDIQDGAEQCQQWRWMEDRHVWRADVGYQWAAEISRGNILERFDVEVGLKPCITSARPVPGRGFGYAAHMRGKQTDDRSLTS